MNKYTLSVLFLFAGIFIIGCTAGSNTVTIMEELIITNEINKVEMSKDNTELIDKVYINDTDEIADLIATIQDIPIKRLNKAEDAEFMTPRIADKTMINVIFFSGDQSMSGNFWAWQDGYIYIVDIESMLSGKRTISYLSSSKYPQIYEFLNEYYKN